MSKLLSKIEEKLGGSSSNEEQSRLQKSPPESRTTTGNTSDWSNRTSGNDSGLSESVRHPISSTGRPTGTAVDNNYNSTSNTYDSRGGTEGTLSSMPGGYSSSGTTNRAEPREPFDPYSAKGQQTAADATPNRPGEPTYPSNQTHNLGKSSMDTAPRRTGEGSHLSRRTEPGYSTTTTSDHHYGRDAGIVGGAGTAGVGAYELGQHSGRSDTSYMSRDTVGGLDSQTTQDHNRRPFVDDSAGRGGAGAMSANTFGSGGAHGEESAEFQAKKMSDAYQAGYRDAMEHMKSGR